MGRCCPHIHVLGPAPRRPGVRRHGNASILSNEINEMALSQFSSRRSRLVALVIAALAHAHFALSVILWTLFAGKGFIRRSDWPQICSAIVLLAVFILAFC